MRAAIPVLALVVAATMGAPLRAQTTPAALLVAWAEAYATNDGPRARPRSTPRTRRSGAA
ncbi:hypothetical protein [Falsiroseomonas sp. HW251]|uniref:hypothetical protein n=1 Tax=Falsiroseomonas sp. HW251 TaxID=3390998 RepID=UPI003D313FC5